MTRESACAILGVPPHCTQGDAKRAYHNLARAFHPDKGGDAGRFQDVQRAHEHLVAGWRRDTEARSKVSERARHGVAKKSSAWTARSGKDTRDGARDPDVASTSGDAKHDDAPSSAVMPGENLRALGDEALKAGDFARAVECYGAALAYARLDDYAAVHRSRAIAHSGLGNWAECAADAGRACDARGLWLEPRLLRGEALEKLERWTAAIDCYEAAMEIHEGGAGFEEEPQSHGGDGSGVSIRTRIEAGTARARTALATRSCVAVMREHSAAVSVIAFAPKMANVLDDEGGVDERGQLLASGSHDGAVKLWLVPSGERVLTLKCVDSDDGGGADQHPVTDLAWAPREVDGCLRLVAASVTGALTLWHLARVRRDDGCGVSIDVAKTIRVFGPDGGVASVAFDVESRQLAIGSDAGDVTLWSARDGEVLRAPRRRHKKAINDLAFHPSGWQLVSGSADGVARVWDLAGMSGADPGTCQHTLKWSQGPITNVCYTACGRMICTTSSTHLAKDGGEYRLLVWSAVSGRLCQWFDAHKGPVTSMSWHPDATGAKNTLVTGCEDGIVRMWHVRGAPQGAGKPTHECYKFRGDDGGDDGAGEWGTHARDVTEAKLRDRSMRARGGPGGYLSALGTARCLRHSPDGRAVGAAFLDGKVRVVDSCTFDTRSEWTLETTVNACDWAPCEVKLAPLAREDGDDSDSDDGSDSDDERSVADEDPKVSEDPKVPHLLLVTGGDDGVVRAWRVPVNKCAEDRATWWDREVGVVDAIGPGDERREAKLPSTTVAFAMAGGDMELALATAYQARGEDPVKAARAAVHLDELKRLYDEVEDEIDELVDAREVTVAEKFPGMKPKARRRVNAAHAEAMRPLRERRGRLYRMIQHQGFVEKEELEKEDYEEAQPPALPW